LDQNELVAEIERKAAADAEHMKHSLEAQIKALTREASDAIAKLADLEPMHATLKRESNACMVGVSYLLCYLLACFSFIWFQSVLKGLIPHIVEANPLHY
jgi:hypothetical protein